MPDKDFDEHINRMLNGLDFTPEPGDWDLFARSMDTPDAPPVSDLPLDHPMDALVRASLAGFEADGAQLDWEAFSAQLDEHPLDTAVRASLAQLELAGAEADWPLMEHELNTPFYQQVRSQLDGYETPYLSRDWALMREMLRKQGMYRSMTGWATWTTVGLAACISFVIGIFLLKGPVLYRGPYPGPVLAQSAVATPPPLSPAIQSYRPESQAAMQVSATGMDTRSEEFRADVVSQEIIPVAPTLSEAMVLTGIRPPQALIAWEPVNQISFDPIEARPEPRKRPVVRLGFLLGPTGTNAELTDPASPGWAAGLRTEVQLSERFSILTGIFASEKRFVNRSYVFGNSSQVSLRDEASAVDVEGFFQTIEAPLLIRCYLPSEEKVRIYAQAGAVTMVALQENYKKTPVKAEGSGSLSRQPIVSSRRFNTYAGNVQAAMGMEYEVKPGISLQIEPYFQLGLQRTEGSGSLGTQKKLYSAGLMAGMAMKL